MADAGVAGADALAAWHTALAAENIVPDIFKWNMDYGIPIFVRWRRNGVPMETWQVGNSSFMSCRHGAAAALRAPGPLPIIETVTKSPAEILRTILIKLARQTTGDTGD